jgi:hypothetical protein
MMPGHLGQAFPSPDNIGQEVRTAEEVEPQLRRTSRRAAFVSLLRRLRPHHTIMHLRQRRTRGKSIESSVKAAGRRTGPVGGSMPRISSAVPSAMRVKRRRGIGSRRLPMRR